MTRYFCGIMNGLSSPVRREPTANDTDATTDETKALIGVSLDRPAVDPERHILVTDGSGNFLDTPVFQPSAEHPAR
jgi:hypothetical protein